MQEAFGIVIFVVVGVAIVAAVYAAVGSGALYKQIGRGGLSLDSDDDHPRQMARAVSQAVADEEIRQMLTAKNARREARGQEPLDIESELVRLKAAAAGIDPELEAEIRSLVIARNERRQRQGKEPLDVEAEVAARSRNSARRRARASSAVARQADADREGGQHDQQADGRADLTRSSISSLTATMPSTMAIVWLEVAEAARRGPRRARTARAGRAGRTRWPSR